MKVEQRSPSDPASRLRMTIIETSRKRQRERLLPRSANAFKRQPLPVTPDKLKPNIENITGEKAKALISGYSPEALHRWQQSIVNQSSPKAVIDDGSILYQKLRGQFFRSNGRMPELKDLVEISDQALEEMMAGSKKKEEMTAIRQQMVRHNVLPSDSQIVFQIDLLGLPERAREILVSHNIKTIESICQIIGKELESDEKTMSISRFIKNQLLKFIQELAEWEKMNPSPEKPKRRRKRKKQTVLEQHGLKELSPEEKLERKRREIISKLSAVNGIGDNPIGYINQKLKDEVTARDLFSDLRKKGLEIKSDFIFYRWLRVLDIPVQSKLQAKGAIYQEGADVYREAKQAGLLTRLTDNQRTSLELVFDQGLTISGAAHSLSVERNKTVPYQFVSQSVIGALKRLEKLKSLPEKKELTGLAYLQVMFPGRLGTRTYNTLKKKKNINTLEELKSILPNVRLLIGIGSKGTQACVDLLKHFFPGDDQIINPFSLSESAIARAEKQAIEPLPQINQQALKKWQESRQNEAKLDKIGLPDNIFNVFQEAGWTLKKIIDIPDDNLLRLLGNDIRKLIAVRKALINNNIISKNSDLNTELDLLGLPTKTTIALKRADIKTLKEFYSLTEKQLLFIKKIGPTSLGLIRLNLTRLKDELEAFIS